VVKAAIAFFPGAEDGEATVFLVHIDDTDFLQQVLLLAEHFS
jgi:hypothetical protein